MVSKNSYQHRLDLSGAYEIAIEAGPYESNTGLTAPSLQQHSFERNDLVGSSPICRHLFCTRNDQRDEQLAAFKMPHQVSENYAKSDVLSLSELLCLEEVIETIVVLPTDACSAIFDNSFDNHSHKSFKLTSRTHKAPGK